MARRLTEEQINARCEAYEEAVAHLGMMWTDDEEEKRQAVIVCRQIEALRDRLILSHPLKKDSANA